jgi:hypothetical protein
MDHAMLSNELMMELAWCNPTKYDLTITENMRINAFVCVCVCTVWLSMVTIHLAAYNILHYVYKQYRYNMDKVHPRTDHEGPNGEGEV